MKSWMRSNPGENVTIYDIPQLLSAAHNEILTPKNIISGFTCTEIFPFNQMVFSETDYAPSTTTDEVNGALYEGKGQDEPGPFAQWDEPGLSAQRDEPGPSAQRDEPGLSAQRDEPGPSAQRDEPGPSAQQDEPGPSAQWDELGPSAQRDEPGPSTMPPTPNTATHFSYVSPMDIRPLPKADRPQVTRRGRKK
ncbi:hypothetical protein RRG08_027916 [Elysia crispata]|uniref:Uncharacterized protein n=1 Tax=Elysia crispata TaxID=231223 RepID=A0AAE1DUT8_9GAST|nr:hypothetical protein RRG08_027916 [Elysia crispata]